MAVPGSAPAESSERWVRAGATNELAVAMYLFAILYPGGILSLFWEFGLLTGPLVFSVLLPAFVVLSGVSTPLILLFCFLQPRAIHVEENGVTFRFVGRTVTIPWTAISPDLLTFTKSGLRIRYVRPGGRAEPAALTLTPAQGRALLGSRFAPNWVGPPEVLRRWGIESGQPRM